MCPKKEKAEEDIRVQREELKQSNVITVGVSSPKTKQYV